MCNLRWIAGQAAIVSPAACFAIFKTSACLIRFPVRNDKNNTRAIVETHVWKIDWNDGLSVVIPEINEDHNRFISLVNEFNRFIVDRMDLSEIKKRLQLIIDDAVQHFAHEERLFKEWHYPDVDPK
jgi:hypothetical protein